MPTVQEALDRVWSDESLKRRLLTDPKPVLREFGLNFSDSVTVRVHENTPAIFNAVLPEKPAGAVSVPNGDPVSKIIARAWTDPQFKSRLLSDPNEAARDMGLNMPGAVTLRVWENTASVENIVLPLNPANSELSDMELEAVAGGTNSKTVQPLPTTCLSTGGNMASTLLKVTIAPSVSSQLSVPGSGKG